MDTLTKEPNHLESSLPAHRVAASDRRRQPRVYPSILSAVLDAGVQRWVVMIADISLSGARILNAPPELSVGDSLCLATLLHGSDTMTIPCTIVRMEGNPAHSEIGVHFEPAAEADTSALDRYLRRHFDGDAEVEDVALES